MAREQLNYTATAWKDLEAGGTAITAARLNNIETGIADADAAVNAVNATVLTYLVASDGDTATTDINGAAITGPCFVHDLGTGDTYLDKGQEDQSRVQVGVSKAAFAALRDSVSSLGYHRCVKNIRMTQSGRFNLTEFDSFKDLKGRKIISVNPAISACASQYTDTQVMWRTYDGSDIIHIISPIVQDIYLNIDVWYM